MPTLTLHGINGDSAGNYHLMNKESNRGREFHQGIPPRNSTKESWNHYHPEDVWNAMSQHSHYTGVINPVIITLLRTFGTRYANTHTTWDKWRFCRELPPHEQGIQPRKGIPPGIISSFTQIQAGKIKMHGKSFER
jgi:hypothetical protein